MLEKKVAETRNDSSLSQLRQVHKMKRDGRGGPREGSGRPPIEPGEKTIPVAIRMTELQRETFDRLGGADWVRAEINRHIIRKLARDPGQKG